jgi:hypothetical protein
MTSEGNWDSTMNSIAEEEDMIRASLDSPWLGDIQPHYISSCSVDLRDLAIQDVATMDTLRRKGTVSAEALAKKWYIGIETAKCT